MRAGGVIGAMGDRFIEMFETPGQGRERWRFRRGIGTIAAPWTVAHQFGCPVLWSFATWADGPAIGDRLPTIFLIGETGEAVE